MKVQTISSENEQHLRPKLKWDYLFFGKSIDKRSRAAINFAKNTSKKASKVIFNIEQPDRLKVTFNIRKSGKLKTSTKSLPLNETTKIIPKSTTILFEATSLGMVEILFLLRAAKEAGLKNVDFLYIEPLEYAKNQSVGIFSREYSLSMSHPLQGVRGFFKPNNILAKDSKLITFLGYEGARLARVCTDEEALSEWRKYAIFGIPSYVPGWDMNAIANNIDCLSTNKFDTIRYCAASSVSNAYKLLKKIHGEGHYDGTHTVVAPFGTKPHSIATAMFLVDQPSNQTASLLYDHPELSKHRSTDVRRWHLYRVTLAD